MTGNLSGDILDQRSIIRISTTTTTIKITAGIVVVVVLIGNFLK